MQKSLPPLPWFRAFEAAARLLSFTAAADEIGLTQPAVSQQIKALETRIGTPLFTRHARGLSLTDEGRRLLPQVSTALETLANATRHVPQDAGRAQLTIAASVSMMQWVIAPRLAEFTRAHPGVRLRFLSAIWPDDFHASRADVELRFGSAAQAGRDAVRLLPDRLIAVRAPFLTGTPETLPLIEAVGTSDGWAGWKGATSALAKPTLFADSYGMAAQLASHGNGVALVSEVLVRPALASGVLVRADDADCAAHEGYFLSINPGNPAAKAFRDWLMRIVGMPVPV